MELIENNVQLRKRATTRQSIFDIGIADITAIEEELNSLQALFSAASFMLPEHNFRALSDLRSRHSQLKLEVVNHFQMLKYNSSENRRLMLKSGHRLNASLVKQILSLRSRLQKFHSKLFENRKVNRNIL
jgi:hypothetical protein